MEIPACTLILTGSTAAARVVSLLMRAVAVNGRVTQRAAIMRAGGPRWAVLTTAGVVTGTARVVTPRATWVVTPRAARVVTPGSARVVVARVVAVAAT